MKITYEETPEPVRLTTGTVACNQPFRLAVSNVRPPHIYLKVSELGQVDRFVNLSGGHLVAGNGWPRLTCAVPIVLVDLTIAARDKPEGGA